MPNGGSHPGDQQIGASSPDTHARSRGVACVGAASCCKYAVPEGYPDKPLKNSPIDLSGLTSPDLAYYGAVGRGLWKTTNGGEDWAPITDFKITSASVGAVCPNPAMAAGGTPRTLRGTHPRVGRTGNRGGISRPNHGTKPRRQKVRNKHLKT